MEDLTPALDPSLTEEELVGDLLPVALEIGGNIRENRGERPYPQCAVAWDRDVVLATPDCGRESEMASRLASRLVPELREGTGKLRAGKIARQSQAGMTSSRTTCRRMSDGRSASSKWQRTASCSAVRSSSSVSACVKIE